MQIMNKSCEPRFPEEHGGPRAPSHLPTHIPQLQNEGKTNDDLATFIGHARDLREQIDDPGKEQREAEFLESVRRTMAQERTEAVLLAKKLQGTYGINPS